MHFFFRVYSLLLRLLIAFCTVSLFCFCSISAFSEVVSHNVEYDSFKHSAINSEKSYFPSVHGPWKKSLLLKPYLTIGYSVPIIPQHSFTPNPNLFSDLTTFFNWTAGIGLQVTQYLGIELGYSSVQTLIHLESAKNNSFYGQFIYLTASAFTPALNLKFITISGSVHAGMAGMFGVQNTISNLVGTVSNNGGVTVTSAGPQFIGGASLVIGFSRMVSIRIFIEAITLSDSPFGMNVILRSGFAVNVYLL